MPRPKGVVVDGVVIATERERQNLSPAELAAYTRQIARAAERTRGEAATDPGLCARTIINAEKGKRASKRTARLIARALQLPYLFVVRHDLEEIAGRLTREGLRPEPPPREWVGRRVESDALAARLLGGDRSACIVGTSGCGKTALARHIALRQDIRAQYVHGTIWLGNSPALRERRYEVMMEQIARALGFLQHLPASADHDSETIAQRFRDCLAKGRVLLIFDDLQDEATMRWFVPAGSQIGTLVTTASQVLASKLAVHCEPLGELSIVKDTGAPASRSNSGPVRACYRALPAGRHSRTLGPRRGPGLRGHDFELEVLVGLQ